MLEEGWWPPGHGPCRVAHCLAAHCLSLPSGGRHRRARSSDGVVTDFPPSPQALPVPAEVLPGTNRRNSVGRSRNMEDRSHSASLDDIQHPSAAGASGSHHHTPDTGQSKRPGPWKRDGVLALGYCGVGWVMLRS